jgi:hypothetical protein
LIAKNVRFNCRAEARYASTSTASPVAKTELTYDIHGRLSTIAHTGTATGSTFAETHGYSYDDVNRLASYTNIIDNRDAL